MLRPGGRLAVFWNAFQPPAELAEAFAAVYRRVLPDSPVAAAARPTPARTRTRRCPARRPTASGRRAAFGEPEQWRFDWEHVYTRDEWLDQLPTSGGRTRAASRAGGGRWPGSAPRSMPTAARSPPMYATVVVTATR